jgi:hypothetical protein
MRVWVEAAAKPETDARRNHDRCDHVERDL